MVAPLAMRTIAIIQARLGSTRLPGKVLMDLGGKPMLVHVIERARAIWGVDDVRVAVPYEDAMEIIGRLHAAGEVRATVYPGHPTDVLDRFWWNVGHADIIMRLTGDCPLLAPEVAELALESFLSPAARAHKMDYLGTTRPDTAHQYADGFDVEVISRAALEAAHREATGKDREHVTSFIWRQPERFKIVGLKPELEWAWMRDYKLSVDTQKDLDRVRAIHARIPAGNFSLAATLKAAKEVGL